MCKAVNNYSHSVRFDRYCYKTQKMYSKAAGTYPSVIQFVPKRYKSKEMCHKVVGNCLLYLILFLTDI